MNIHEAVKIVEALAAGCDPHTGEDLDESHMLRRPDIAEALSSLTDAFHIIRGALTSAESEGIYYSPGDPEVSDADAYEAVQEKFGVKAAGGPSRFGDFRDGPR